jgi:transposase
MMRGLILNQREQARLQVLNSVLEKQCSMVEAATLLGVSERHGWRLLATYRQQGAAALAHGNRGHQPVHTTPAEVKERVLALARGPYAGFNYTHLSEELAQQEGLPLSPATVRRILLTAGLKSPRQRRPPKYRCRRERYPQKGMLLQVDGSRHDWLEGRGPYLTLLAAIDDATGTVPYALFREQEDTQGYFLLLKETIQRKGIPLALYSDRHGIFQRSPQEPATLAEQLAGERNPTQFGRALGELRIESILALSPQAKGRIERLWGTWQDRLVAELRLAGTDGLAQANQVLWAFLTGFNARFGVPAAQPGLAYRPRAGLDLAGVLCFKYQRTVAKDNTIRFAGHTIQLLPGLERCSYARARVEVQERLDGSLVVCYQGQVIATREAPPQPVTLRARKGTQQGPGGEAAVRGRDRSDLGCLKDMGENGHLPKVERTRPGAEHPWRKSGLLTKSLHN